MSRRDLVLLISFAIYKNKLFLFFNNIFFNLSMQFDVLREKKNIIRV